MGEAMNAKVIIEKVFFTESKQLFTFSELETDSLLVPTQILDCITWLQIENFNK